MDSRPPASRCAAEFLGLVRTCSLRADMLRLEVSEAIQLLQRHSLKGASCRRSSLCLTATDRPLRHGARFSSRWVLWLSYRLSPSTPSPTSEPTSSIRAWPSKQSVQVRRSARRTPGLRSEERRVGEE